MSIAECYVLDVQCDFGPHVLPVRGEFTGPNAAVAHKAARQAGWKLYQSQWKAKCPHCVKKPSEVRS